MFRRRHLRFIATVATTLVIATPAVHATDEDDAISAFGERLARAFNDRDLEAIERMIDTREFGRRAAKTVFERESRRSAFAEGLASSAMLENALRAAEAQDTFVRMMGIVEREGDRRPLLRAAGEGGYEYLEYVLRRDGDGDYVAIDWFTLTTGQLGSVSVGAVSRLLLDPNPTLLETLLGRSANAELAARFRSIGELRRAGKLREAWEEIAALSNEFPGSRELIVIQTDLANQLGDEALYRRSLDQLAKRFGEDPSSAFLLLDHHFFKEDWDSALRSIAAIERRVGTDGVILFLRSTVLSRRGDHERAVETARAAVEKEPELVEAHMSLALLYASKGEFAKTVEVFRNLSQRWGMEFSRSDFQDSPEFQAFVASKEFDAWIGADAD